MTDKDRPLVFCSDLANGLHQLQVVFGGFSEANTGIKADAICGNAVSRTVAESCFEKCADLSDNIFVMRLRLHGLRCPQNVHHTDRNISFCTECRHLIVKRHSRNIVDD